MITPGKILLYGFHRPLAIVRDSWRNGGPLAQRRTAAGRREMERAAAALPPLPPSSAAPIELHVLTGRRFWYQTAFCLWTFARQAGVPVRPAIYDDGTLEAGHRAELLRLFPLGRVEAPEQIRDRLERLLPASRFPVLRERWRNYPNLRKLIDPHLGFSGWKLVIDSDLLFFHRPGFLLDWLAAPDRPLHAVDCAESYGYSRGLMESLAGAPIPPRVNVGLCGWDGGALDWPELERWCAELIRRERTHYYLEQALVAMLAARRACAVAPVSDYVTCPARAETRARRAVMHHYVADSKRWYFQETWRAAIAG